MGSGFIPTSPTTLTSLTLTSHSEVNQGSRGLADPVALHLLDALGPVELVEVLEQPLGVLGDLQHPLAHRTPDDGMVAALRAAVNDLLVRKHRAERGAPVDRNLRNVRESLLVELLEYPLRPLVVLRVRRVDLAVPVVAEAERPDLLAEAVHVLLRGDGGMRAGLDRVLLGREAEGVPSHGMQDLEALHALVAAEHVGRGVPLGMPYMQTSPGWIREHVEAVKLRLLAARSLRRLESLVLQPVLLPFSLNGNVIVVHLRPLSYLYVESGSRNSTLPRNMTEFRFQRRSGSSTKR